MANCNTVGTVFQSSLGCRVTASDHLLFDLGERLDYVFKDEGLARTALTHGSSHRRAVDYQRLEFLGDRVLSLVIAEQLYRQHTDEKEGQMATRHSALVKGDVCADIADAIGLGDFIIVGASEKRLGVQRVRSVLGDVLEALIGAVYLDGGLAPAEAMVKRLWAQALSQQQMIEKDPKTFVQEWALGKGMQLPRYEITLRTGPEHMPEFTVALRVGKFVPTEGKGASRQSAEMAAAKTFLSREGLR
jgi:ribonuclease III